MNTLLDETSNTADALAGQGLNTEGGSMEELVNTSTGEVVTALVRPDSWSGAAVRGLEARREREAIVKEILREGHDFGTVPGCGDKPALLKPGAEKIADALNLYPDYEEMDKVQDFANRVWFYRYRCRLRQRGSDIVMSTGIGSCNSEAAKYKYRDAQRECPECGKPAIIKGKAEYGGGWLCFARKGGCGAKFDDNDARITDQQTGQIENPDIASLVNTVDKMAQKSAFVAACLNLGFSEQFTQDIDENPQAFSGNKTEDKPAAATDVPKCPECTGPMWDNRATKTGRQPDFKCKDKACNKAVWVDGAAKSEVGQLRQAAVDQCRLLNEHGDEIEWSATTLNEFTNKHFGARSDQLELEPLRELVKKLSLRYDDLKKKETGGKGLEQEAKDAEIKKIRTKHKPEDITNWLRLDHKGKTLEDLTLDQLLEADDGITPF